MDFLHEDMNGGLIPFPQKDRKIGKPVFLHFVFHRVELRSNRVKPNKKGFTMSNTRPYQTFKGEMTSRYPGRIFIRITGYKPACTTALREAGARKFKDNSFLLPETGTDQLMSRLDTLFVQDQTSALRDRTPVAVNVANTLKVGDIFDFGGEVGKAEIITMGKSFTPKKTGADRRVIVGQEMVYVYNVDVNVPDVKPKMTEEQKTAQSEADKTRLPVRLDSVTEGETISVNGNQVTITSLGRAWEIVNQEAMDKVAARFPNEASGFNIGDTIHLAKFESPAAETKVEAEPETSVEAETRVEVNPETRVETETRVEPETRVNAKPETRIDAKIEAEPRAEPEAVPETKVDADSGTDMGTGQYPAGEPETGMGAGQDLTTETETGMGAGQDSTAGPESDTGTDEESTANMKSGDDHGYHQDYVHHDDDTVNNEFGPDPEHDIIPMP